MRALLCVCALVAIGCGGSGGGGTSPLAGTYAGTWGSPTAPGTSGTLAFTVNGSGDFSGTIVNSGLGENGTLTGHIGTDNKLTGAIDYPDHDCTLEGTVETGAAIKGTILLMTEKYGRTVYISNFTLNCPRQ